MGNENSGRWKGHQPKNLTENYLYVDSRVWKGTGKIFAGSSFEWFLFDFDGAPIGYVAVTVFGSYIEMQYYTVDALKVDYLYATVMLTWTESRFTAYVWFVCPTCGRRVRILYLDQEGIKCRKCYCLAYRSQRRNLCR
jgi:hypothetical protein